MSDRSEILTKPQLWAERRLTVTPVAIHKKGADKSLARPDWKNNWKVAIFYSDALVIATAETRLDGQPSELFLSDLQKLGFGRCSIFSFLVGLRIYRHPGNYNCASERQILDAPEAGRRSCAVIIIGWTALGGSWPS